MKRITLLLFILICLAACVENKCVIEGKVLDAGYEGEVVYLVPFKNPTRKTVDSTVIQNGNFRFNVKPKKQNQVYIIRVKPVLRLKLQDIIVIAEQGIIQVNFNQRSSSSGTPLNHTLQQWKERKRVIDSTYYSLRRQYNKETNEAEKRQLQTRLDSILQSYHVYADSLSGKNKDNAVGQLIGSLLENK